MDFRKTAQIQDFKSYEEGDKFYFSGYANTKNNVDSHGDIPTNYKGAPVYELDRFKKNPVLLIDHKNSSGSVIGNVVEIEEDVVGLRFKALLRNVDDVHTPELKDAITGIKTGFIRGISIGGSAKFEDPKNKRALTKANIYEISVVAVPSDGNSMSYSTMAPKNMDLNTIKEEKPRKIVELIKMYRESGDEDLLPLILKEKKDGRN